MGLLNMHDIYVLYALPLRFQQQVGDFLLNTFEICRKPLGSPSPLLPTTFFIGGHMGHILPFGAMHMDHGPSDRHG